MQIFKSNNIYLIHGHGNIVKMNRGNSSKSTEPVHKQPTKILPNPDRNIRETTMIWSEHSRKKIRCSHQIIWETAMIWLEVAAILREHLCIRKNFRCPPPSLSSWTYAPKHFMSFPHKKANIANIFWGSIIRDEGCNEWLALGFSQTLRCLPHVVL